jgi:RimJ/RimL family protein N-acetyltransferase
MCTSDKKPLCEFVCESPRLRIRELTLDDTAFIIELLNQDSFIRYIGDKLVRSEDDAIRYLNNGPLASYQRYGFGLNAVLLKGHDTPIGMCGLLKRDELEYPDIGYAFLPIFCAQGYALEAATSVLRHTVKSHALTTVLAVTLPENISSNRLLGKLGFTFKASIELYHSVKNLYEYQASTMNDLSEIRAS